MKKIKILKMKNAYGIKELKSVEPIYQSLIYCLNGTFKTSFVNICYSFFADYVVLLF